MVTIGSFQLNGLPTRRASILAPLWLSLETLANNPPAAIEQQVYRALDRACSPRSEFSACMSAGRQRFDTDRASARELGKMANLLTDG